MSFLIHPWTSVLGLIHETCTSLWILWCFWHCEHSDVPSVLRGAELSTFPCLTDTYNATPLIPTSLLWKFPPQPICYWEITATSQRELVLKLHSAFSTMVVGTAQNSASSTLDWKLFFSCQLSGWKLRAHSTHKAHLHPPSPPSVCVFRYKKRAAFVIMSEAPSPFTAALHGCVFVCHWRSSLWMLCRRQCYGIVRVLWFTLCIIDVLQARSSLGKLLSSFLRCFALVWVILEEQAAAQEAHI